MGDHPEYEIGELLLCALFMVGAGTSLLWAAASFSQGEHFSAVEGAGLGLAFLSGGTSPTKYLMDCLTFPFSLVEHSGRETPLTVLAGYGGLVMGCVGAAGNYWS
ncbi:hypothetical protein [Zoogloea sp.]|uniref:hypothetical protein n=1 Tax=Zoogloea sp. TaxID=49181 RepID=UPI0035B3E16C|nr:hypothetical protein [Rhodocyclales bacterium]